MADRLRPELDRLRELGLAEHDLMDVVWSGYLQASTYTPHHPKTAPGLGAWFEMVRRLRDIHVPLGWIASSAYGYEVLIAPDRSIQIAVATGDSNTGLPDPAVPRTKTNKGPLTRRALINNRFLRSFAEISPVFASTAPKPPPTTFILLHHADREKNEIRAELSIPAEMDRDDYVIAWAERIRLLPLIAGLTLPPDDPDDPDDPDAIDIDVPPRA